ncbi:hypothetical protein QBC43DRAFT_54223 [Cladorrhinum sp. PSN259]|nr:hypothetical protein QBC43DRAFT_54223 [Cladorrhinum sp. PSN259]
MSHTGSKDGPQDYMHEIEQLENDFIDIEARINAFEDKSKDDIQADRSLMLLALQRSVESVEGTILYVNTDNSRLANSLEYDGASTASGGISTSQSLVRRHLEDMDASFTGLHGAASTGLERIQHIKKSYDDMDGELAGLRTKLSSLSDQYRAALASATQERDAEKADAAKIKTELESTRAERQALESKVGHRKIARNTLRAARAATWTLCIICPPAIATAGGLEYVATKMRHRLKTLQKEIDSVDLRLSCLNSKIATIDARIESLEQVLTNSRSLWARVDAMETNSAKVKSLVDEQLGEYQAVKESTDDFSAWTQAVADQTAPMRLLGSDSGAALRRTIGQIVKRLLETDQGDVKSICERLERLERLEVALT